MKFTLAIVLVAVAVCVADAKPNPFFGNLFGNMGRRTGNAIEAVEKGVGEAISLFNPLNIISSVSKKANEVKEEIQQDSGFAKQLDDLQALAGDAKKLVEDTLESFAQKTEAAISEVKQVAEDVVAAAKQAVNEEKEELENAASSSSSSSSQSSDSQASNSQASSASQQQASAASQQQAAAQQEPASSQASSNQAAATEQEVSSSSDAQSEQAVADVAVSVQES